MDNKHDHKTKTKENQIELGLRPSPYDSAGLISKTFFWWINEFIWRGQKTETITIDNLYACPRYGHSHPVGNVLQREWDAELRKAKKSKHKPSLLMALCRSFGLWWSFFGFLSIITECIFRVLTPVFLGWLLTAIENHVRIRGTEMDSDEAQEARMWEIGWYVVGIVLTTAGYSLFLQPYYYGMQRYGMYIRVACCKLVYAKALRLSRAALGQTTVGQMVNLLSNDVQRFDQSLLYVPNLIGAPIQAIITIIILWPRVGVSCLAGMAVLGLYLPLQASFGKICSILRQKTAILTDERVRLMNEIIPAMRVIKMYAWEVPFAKLVDLARRREVRMIKIRAVLWSANMGLFFISSKVICFITFMVFLALGNHFTSETVFVTMSLFNVVRTSMTLFFPYAIFGLAEIFISVQRLETFLKLEEQSESPNYIKNSDVRSPSEVGVWIEKVTAKWTANDSTTEHDTLSRLNFTVRPKELTVCVGPVGAGKSSILMAILGEIPITSGQVRVNGRIAYASQEPWTFGGSVRENILFGQPYDPIKYRQVIHVCALERDLTLFPYGDKTLVGERGVTLSGGQKARVNLARALYHDADIYLLDDPLSAVDSHVAHWIFNKAITSYLRDKCVILVTHQIQFIKHASQIIYLQHGTCFAQGTFEHLIKQGIDFMKLEAEEQSRRGSVVSKSSDANMESNQLRRSLRMRRSNLNKNRSPSSVSSLKQDMQNGDLSEAAEAKISDSIEEPDRFEEKAAYGSIKARIYMLYIRYGAGPLMLPLVIFSNIACQVLFNLTDYWLKLWTDSEEKRYNTAMNVTSSAYERKTFVDDFDRRTNMIIYTVLVVLLFSFSIIRACCFFLMCLRSSIKLHDKLFKSVIRAPVSFFDNTPSGILLNRASRDVGLIDEFLPATFFDAVEIILNFCGVIVLNGYLNPWTLIPAVILLIIMAIIRTFFVKVSRHLKRLEGVTKSPVYSHLSNSLYGLCTLRAFRVQQDFENKFDYYQDVHSAAWFSFISASRWFAITLDWTCIGYIAVVTIAMSAAINGADVEPSSIGLAITTAIMLTNAFQFGVRQSIETENQMTSVERVDEYSNLEPEGELESSPDRKPPPEWPQHGSIEFKDVSLQYNEHDPPVLKNLNFSVKPKEKVGIVGRTGAGKSSMIAALFRMQQPSGHIIIDGIDTQTIGLHELRSKISIIPQDPVLFTGPVRRNLDPFSLYTDDRLWEALEDVQLAEAVKELEGGLDAVLSEGGSNFSVGQRQLICLARAILKQNKILVLDEATANVDHKTDHLIQRTIRDKFANCTVLTIAHRLNTIMDSDRVLVLDAGQIIENDHPYKLLQDDQGMFTSMVRQTGDLMASNLYHVARAAYENALNANESES